MLKLEEMRISKDSSLTSHSFLKHRELMKDIYGENVCKAFSPYLYPDLTAFLLHTPLPLKAHPGIN